MKEDQIYVFLRIIEKSIKLLPVPVVGNLAWHDSDPFKILIACILSLRTRDQITSEASERLFAISSDPYILSKTTLKKLEMAIFPVGFFRTKAKQIKAMSHIICKNFKGKTPDTMEELLCLPGVGRKTANLVLTLGYKQPGICVDTHVHRICNRWGYVTTTTPDQTERVLREKLPTKFWIPLNGLLVPFGQYQCTPLSPRCRSCGLEAICEKIGVLSCR